MLAVRIHLDGCDAGNGALRVVPGSHRLGRLTPAAALNVRAGQSEALVAVPRGGAMLMKPLLLHASSKASADNPRRVLHFVFGPAKLPGHLRWPLQAHR
jgi:ectoine hydroxylase-related dioxygenase (phytanoyl-CoA dioxygenase family)